MGSIPQTFALILNYNCSQETILLFRQLIELELESLNILVIDNNSTEEDKLQLKENIPSENLIFNKKNLGYAGGNNIGIEIALNENAEYIWVLNPDIRINNQTLPILIKTISEDTSLAAVGPRIVHRHNKERIFSDGEMLVMDDKCGTFQKNYNLEILRVPKKIDYNIDYINGSSILLNSRAIREIGKFPEEYFLYFEETDWCFKAKKYKWRLAINSNASVYNLTSLKKSVFHYFFMRNKLIFSKKYHPDYKKVRNYYIKELIGELSNRFKGKYFRPFFISRVKGLISGIVKTRIKM